MGHAKHSGNFKYGIQRHVIYTYALNILITQNTDVNKNNSVRICVYGPFAPVYEFDGAKMPVTQSRLNRGVTCLYYSQSPITVNLSSALNKNHVLLLLISKFRSVALIKATRGDFETINWHTI